jgi:hypothetical protein
MRQFLHLPLKTISRFLSTSSMPRTGTYGTSRPFPAGPIFLTPISAYAEEYNGRAKKESRSVSQWQIETASQYLQYGPTA